MTYDARMKIDKDNVLDVELKDILIPSDDKDKELKTQALIILLERYHKRGFKDGESYEEDLGPIYSFPITP